MAWFLLGFPFGPLPVQDSTWDRIQDYIQDHIQDHIQDYIQDHIQDHLMHPGYSWIAVSLVS